MAVHRGRFGDTGADEIDCIIAATVQGKGGIGRIDGPGEAGIATEGNTRAGRESPEGETVGGPVAVGGGVATDGGAGRGRVEVELLPGFDDERTHAQRARDVEHRDTAHINRAVQARQLVIPIVENVVVIGRGRGRVRGGRYRIVGIGWVRVGLCMTAGVGRSSGLFDSSFPVVFDHAKFDTMMNPFWNFDRSIDNETRLRGRAPNAQVRVRFEGRSVA